MSRNQKRPPTAAPSIHGYPVSRETLTGLSVAGVGFFKGRDYLGAQVAELKLNIEKSTSPSAHNLQNPVLPKIIVSA